MFYIRLLLVSLLITSCSSTNETNIVSSSGLSPLEQSDSERNEYRKAILLLNKNQLDTAKDIFLKLKSTRPELAGPYANLAIIALKQNQPDKALELVKTSLIRNDKLPQALNLLAYIEQENGEIKSAEKHYLEAIKYNENYALAHYNIALLYDIYLQNVDKAIPHYERYMKLINNKDKTTADWVEQLKRTRENG